MFSRVSHAGQPPPLVNLLTSVSQFILISLLAVVLAFCQRFWNEISADSGHNGKESGER